MPKVALFVDTNDIYHTVKRAYDSLVDYKELLDWVKDLGDVTLSKAYVCQYRNSSDKFIHSLTELGFSVRTKDINHTSKACHWGVDLTIDALDFEDMYDTFVLVATHSDYANLLHALMRAGKQTVVMSPPPLNNKLRAICRNITLARSLCIPNA